MLWRVWRRVRDSNPRYSFPYTHFPGVLLQPLGQLSFFKERKLTTIEQKPADQNKPVQLAQIYMHDTHGKKDQVNEKGRSSE